MSIEILFGWIASAFCTLILVPQIIKALQTRHTDDISMYMLVISVAGNVFWVAHASMTQNFPLIVGAGLVSLMSIILIFLKHCFDTT